VLQHLEHAATCPWLSSVWKTKQSYNSRCLMWQRRGLMSNGWLAIFFSRATLRQAKYNATAACSLSTWVRPNDVQQNANSNGEMELIRKLTDFGPWFRPSLSSSTSRFLNQSCKKFKCCKEKYINQSINHLFVKQTQTDKTVTLGNIPVSQDSKAEKPALIGTN